MLELMLLSAVIIFMIQLLAFGSDAQEDSVFFTAAERLKDLLPPELEVVIDGPNLDQRKSWVKQLKAANAVIENRAVCKATDRNYVENRRQEILSWSRNTGKKLEPEALQYLIEVIASAGGTLRSELEKLDCYTGKKPLITLSDCRNIISRTPEAISWQFTSAIVQGNRNAALQLLNALMSQGDNEIGILAQLSSEFQKMMQTHLAMAELQITRLSPRTFDQIPDAVRAAHPDNPLLKLHPYRAFKICESAGALTPAGLGKKLNALRDAARQLVSGGGNRQIIMELLVLKLTEKTP